MKGGGGARGELLGTSRLLDEMVVEEEEEMRRIKLEV